MYDKAPRSPSYPAISLPEALARLQTLYDTEGTTPADREVIAKAIGYSSRNGASDSMIAAITHYGLLEEIGNKRLKISAIGLDILLGQSGDEERQAAIKTAASTPTLFSELSEQFSGSRFSNRNVESYLIKRNYNPKAAARAAKAFRDTMEFKERETQGGPSNNARTSEDDMIRGESLVTGPVSLSAPQGSSTQQSFSIPIDEDFEVQLVFKGQLTDDRIETLIQYLQIMQRRFAKRQTRTFNDEDNNS